MYPYTLAESCSGYEQTIRLSLDGNGGKAVLLEPDPAARAAHFEKGLDVHAFFVQGTDMVRGLQAEAGWHMLTRVDTC